VAIKNKAFPREKLSKGKANDPKESLTLVDGHKKELLKTL
jgi:hypothetical protein